MTIDKNLFLRHKLAGVSNNLHGSINKLSAIISTLPTEIQNKKFDPRLDTTLVDYVSMANRDIDTIRNILLNIKEFEKHN